VVSQQAGYSDGRSTAGPASSGSNVFASPTLRPIPLSDRSDVSTLSLSLPSTTPPPFGRSLSSGSLIARDYDTRFRNWENRAFDQVCACTRRMASPSPRADRSRRRPVVILKCGRATLQIWVIYCRGRTEEGIVRAVRILAGIVLAMGIVTILFIPDLFDTDAAEEIPWVIGVSVIAIVAGFLIIWFTAKSKR
jgi:hypothetical protein